MATVKYTEWTNFYFSNAQPQTVSKLPQLPMLIGGNRITALGESLLETPMRLRYCQRLSTHSWDNQQRQVGCAWMDDDSKEPSFIFPLQETVGHYLLQNPPPSVHSFQGVC
eukprot:6192012-Amphidinium_carterae.2